MNKILIYLILLRADRLYWKVCVAIFGAVSAIAGGYVAVEVQPAIPLDWCKYLLEVLLGIFGAHIFVVTVFGPDSNFERITRYVDERSPLGFVIGYVAAVIAIPVTLVLKWLRR